MLVDEVFKFNLSIMRIFGLYPPRTYRELYKAYAYVVFYLFIVPVPILSGLYLYLDENVNIEKISDNAFIICEFGCVIFKLLPFISNDQEIRKNLYVLECSIFNMQTKKQEYIMEECIRTCKRNSGVLFVYYMTTFVSWAIAPLIAKKHEFPIQVWLPFDATAEPKIFLTVFIWVSLGIGSGVACYGGVDPLISGLAYCATSQIKLLKNNLQYLGDYAEEEIANEIQDDLLNSKEKEILKAKLIYKKIRFCTDHHNAILDFVKINEKLYSGVVFWQFLVGIVVICIACLRLSMVEPFTATFYSMVLFIFAVILQIFAFCYYGTTLFEESNTLADAVYMGKWYDYDVKSKKALILFMERSQRPIIVTAGKVLDLSLTTFTMILRRSYSLLAVLKNY